MPPPSPVGPHAGSSRPLHVPRVIGRREFVGLGLAAAGTLATATLAACSGDASQPDRQATEAGRPGTAVTTSESPTRTSPKVLVAYFSRTGENYYYGRRTWLEIGNTERVATMIAEAISCDLYRIQAAQPYSDRYQETVDRNVREQNADARPEIANPLPSIDQYDIVLLGSGIWNIRAPMIMSTFAESHDFAGKTIHPFTTHAMSGLGTTERDYAQSCDGATIGEGLAIRGEEASNARPQIAAWLRRIGI
jgi:flavodoxin